MDEHIDNGNDKHKYKQLSIYLTEAFLFMKQFEWISNSYVAEFFTQDLWKKLPTSWRECLENVSLEEVACNILKYSQTKTYTCVWPLSLLSFVATCHALALNREQVNLYENDTTQQVSNIFKKHIKPKKRHELSILPEVIHNICKRTGTNNVVDVGSGLGHLARFLAYKYGYNVTAIEMTSQRLPVAEKFDREMEIELQRVGESIKGRKQFGRVTHVARKIDADITSSEFCTLINTCENEVEDSTCVLIGLHTCGDLASTMLKVFKNTPSICGIVSVSCCYFRMTLKEDLPSDLKAISCMNDVVIGQHNKCELQILYDDFSLPSFYTLINGVDTVSHNCKLPRILQENKINEMKPFEPNHHAEGCKLLRKHPDNYGFPLSIFLQNIPCQTLKYKSFETACHFIDDYSQKLLKNSPNLKLHCYRAVMEVLLRKIDPALVLTAIRCKKIKNAAAMMFSEYAEKVIGRVKKDFHSSMLTLIDCEDLLSQWRSVAIYHSLALLLGPVIESIALVDKWMFLLESNFNVSLLPLFDPMISPRNFVVIATKNNENSDEMENHK